MIILLCYLWLIFCIHRKLPPTRPLKVRDVSPQIKNNNNQPPGVCVIIWRNTGTPEGRVASKPRITTGILVASAPAATRTRRLRSPDPPRPSPAKCYSCTGWTACPSTATGCSTCSACTGTWRRWRSWGTTRCSSSWRTRKPPDGACPTCTCSSWTTRSIWKSSESTR